MKSESRIISFGEIVWDVFEDAKTLGGAPLNFARYCHAFGAETRLVSAVGDDECGREALGAMRNAGMYTGCVSVAEGRPTGRVLVGVNAEGQPCYDIAAPSAWDFIEASPEALAFAANADAIAFGSLAQRSEKSRASLSSIIRACPEKCLKVFDANLRQNYYTRDVIESSLELANVLKLNDEELPVLSGMFSLGACPAAAARELFRRFNLAYLVLTRGKDGHLVIGENLAIDAPAEKAEVVDTVGAGDAFTAAFVTKMLDCASPYEASEAASHAAAEAVSRKGA